MLGETDAVRGHPLDRGKDFFDADWYRREYPDIDDADPWEHFVAHGDAERRSPGPGFDAQFYAGTYLALEEHHALRHFLTHGRRAGHQPRPVPRTAHESRDAMSALLAGVEHPVLLVGNDAQRAGAPLLMLELARHLRGRGWAPVFVLLRGGPLLGRFQALGPTVLIAEGHDVAGLGAAQEPETPIVANTGWAAPVLQQLRPSGPSVLLVQEMPDYLQEHALLEPVARAATIVAALPAVTEQLRERLPAGTPVHTLLPGLLHATGSPEGVTRVERLIAESVGADRLIFLGAGFADERKGFDRFLELAHRIHDLESRSAFVWLGDVGEWGRRCADQARERGLPLLVPGFRLDAPAWYANADVYLLTSRQDPGPTTVMDAARCGVPFVAAPGDLGLQSLGRLLDGVGWFLADEGQVPGRAVAVARSETHQSRAERARHMEGHASFGGYVDDLLQLLRMKGLVDEPSRGR
ncbi:glycosyltransferase [Aeromicrobium duanguangcaii]|uniref:glycosyltransferase n=1 Tax=Aeromicrobium duanguangcaii TaxID=2968086 RepID=UPI002016CC45|nr:glycosyltransferase [Aeromicrobium duanguangcaii]MCL3838754.1 glycosyltransferase [Aeromicrobium duanguangcaii]